MHKGLKLEVFKVEDFAKEAKANKTTDPEIKAACMIRTAPSKDVGMWYTFYVVLTFPREDGVIVEYCEETDSEIAAFKDVVEEKRKKCHSRKDVILQQLKKEGITASEGRWTYE